MRSEHTSIDSLPGTNIPQSGMLIIAGKTVCVCGRAVERGDRGTLHDLHNLPGNQSCSKIGSLFLKM